MKTSIVGLLLSALLAFTGCNNQGTSGGPGASNRSDNKPIVGQADDTFTLDPPSLATKLKQGESKAVAIGINRGKNFDQDVKLKFENLPKGLSIEPSNSVIKHGETEAKLTIKATDDAAVGEFAIKVTGHPAKGPDASNELKVTVAMK
jgi:uncharacterized membrane protein